MTSRLHVLSALELARLLRANQVSPAEVCSYYLNRIARFNNQLAAIVTVTAERALERAERMEREQTAAPLWGMPSADKDLSARAGVASRFGSRAFTDFVPAETDCFTAAMDRAGAVSLGKTATPEFGLIGYGRAAAEARVRNPWHTGFDPGGSSSGAAVAVAAGLLPFAPGSDGGGSIRIPAAACGLVGVKPSRGRVPSATGLDAPGGLAVHGPLARTVADAALLLDGMIAPSGSGVSEPYFYATTAPGSPGRYLDTVLRAEQRQDRFCIGVTTSSPWEDEYELRLDGPAREAFNRACAALANLDYRVAAVPVDERPGYSHAFRVIWQVGAASIDVADSDEELLEPRTRWLREQGRRISATTFEKVLAWAADFETRSIRRFAPFDAVLTPALGMTPRSLGWYDEDDPVRNFDQQVAYSPYTSCVNVAGLPALVLPVMLSDDGFPMGVQLIGRPGGEHALFAIAAKLENALNFRALPAVFAQ